METIGNQEVLGSLGRGLQELTGRRSLVALGHWV